LAIPTLDERPLISCSFQSPIVVSLHHSILTKPITSVTILGGIKYHVNTTHSF